MCAVQRMPDGEKTLPFVLQFCGHPSTHLWEDEQGVVHEIPQGEGGEQGDPLMPALFALKLWKQSRSLSSLGCTDFVVAQLAEKTEEHGILLERIPKVSDLQCAWLLLLFCAASRANYILHVENLVHTPITQSVWEMASLPFGIGGLSLRHAERLHTTAYWSSWADTLPMTRQRHPQVADHILVSLSRGRGGFHLEAAGFSRTQEWTHQSGVMWTGASDQVPTQTTNSLDSQGWGSRSSSATCRGACTTAGVLGRRGELRHESAGKQEQGCL